MELSVIGWTYPYEESYPTTSFTTERHKALVERVRKRRYNFSYQMFLGNYTAPIYNDGFKCDLTKTQWDNVLADAYHDDKMPPRCTPIEVLTFKKNDALWEKDKFVPKGD